MTRDYKYLARLRPRILRAGEPITIEIEKGKLRREDSGITVELYESDNFVAWHKDAKRWRYEDGDRKNKNDLLATWRGKILCGEKDGNARWRFLPDGPATLRDKTTREGQSRTVPVGHVLGAALPIMFEGSSKVFHIPVPFDDTKQDPRDNEGPELELAVVVKRGRKVLYSSTEVVSFVEDWRWWASSSFAPVRAGNTVTYFADGEDYFDRLLDVFESAKKYIYITDWKMIPYICLRRDIAPPEPAYPKTAAMGAVAAKLSPKWEENSVADTLVRAVKRNVDVRVLVWKSPGAFQDNYDDMTFAYLMDRGIKCAFHNPFGDKNATEIFWSHHQKTVVTDDGGSDDLAFVGGLDLAKNRWATQGHRVFDLKTDPSGAYLSRKKEWKGRFYNRGVESDEFVKEVNRDHYDPAVHKKSWMAKRGTRNDRPPLLRDKNPHQGWHDVHCEVNGPSAVDVKRNFVQRWNKSIVGTKIDLNKAGTSIDARFLKEGVDMPSWAGGALALVGLALKAGTEPDEARVRIEQAKNDAVRCRHLGAADWWDDFLTGKKSWSDLVKRLKRKGPGMLDDLPDDVLSKPPQKGGDLVQVIRSIGDGSIDLGIKTYDDYREYKRERGKGGFEKSIQECYLRAIDCAQHYIYIESQMFISAGFPGWDKQIFINDDGEAETDLGRTDFRNDDVENHIAKHLYAKIKSKISAREPFHVYVVLPEIYDGDPHTDPSKEIQRYQWNTMVRLRDAVYELIPAGKAAEDYISFYALRAAGLSTDGRGLVRSNLVYVHSKLMIIDDVFLTMGSANVNDRSMTGYRDSELNVAVLGERNEPVTLGKRAFVANRKIRAFRRSLWREHLGPKASASCLDDPADPKTSDYVYNHGHKNFERFDKLFECEMKLFDLSEEYNRTRRKQEVRIQHKGAPSAELTKRIDQIAIEQEAAHQATLKLYAKLKRAGLLITHPYDKKHRKESRGAMSKKIPSKITT